MSNIRTANKRHKRALTLTLARGKQSGEQPSKAPVAKASPVKAKA